MNQPRNVVYHRFLSTSLTFQAKLFFGMHHNNHWNLDDIEHCKCIGINLILVFEVNIKWNFRIIVRSSQLLITETNFMSIMRNMVIYIHNRITYIQKIRI